LGDEAELNRNKAWRREKGEGAEIDLTFPGGPRRREGESERARARERERDWGREREREERMRPSHAREAGTCTYTQPHPTPTPPVGCFARVGCPRADGSAPPARLRLRHASRPDKFTPRAR